MHGASEVIAIVLILMITIAIAGLTYTFMSTTMASTTSAAYSSVSTTTTSMLTSFVIESVDVAKVYIRNTGQTTLSNLSVYMDEEPAVYSINPSSIAAGQVGTITIYSFIADGGTIKITSPSGFSTSKTVNLCEKTVGCWKMNEGAGTIVYDSSPYTNTGTLVNGATWTAGRYGGGLFLDGVNDYANFSFQFSSNTLSVLVFLKIDRTGSTFANYVTANSFSLWGWPPNNTDTVQIAFSTTNNTGNSTHSYANVPTDTWIELAAIRNETMQRLYVNGVLKDSDAVFGILSNFTSLFMGRNMGGSNFFNGTIDEVRIFNKAIY